LTCTALWGHIICGFLVKAFTNELGETQIFFTMEHVIGHLICHAAFAFYSFYLFNLYQPSVVQWIAQLRIRNLLLNAKEHSYKNKEFEKTKQAVKESLPFPHHTHHLVFDYLKPAKAKLYIISGVERIVLRAIFFLFYGLLAFYTVSWSGDFLGKVFERMSSYILERHLFITTIPPSMLEEPMTIKEKLNAILANEEEKIFFTAVLF
jgi:hypothetical protein